MEKVLLSVPAAEEYQRSESAHRFHWPGRLSLFKQTDERGDACARPDDDDRSFVICGESERPLLQLVVDRSTRSEGREVPAANAGDFSIRGSRVLHQCNSESDDGGVLFARARDRVVPRLQEAYETDENVEWQADAFEVEQYLVEGSSLSYGVCVVVFELFESTGPTHLFDFLLVDVQRRIE